MVFKKSNNQFNSKGCCTSKIFLLIAIDIWNQVCTQVSILIIIYYRSQTSNMNVNSYCLNQRYQWISINDVNGLVKFQLCHQASWWISITDVNGLVWFNFNRYYQISDSQFQSYHQESWWISIDTIRDLVISQSMILMVLLNFNQWCQWSG